MKKIFSIFISIFAISTAVFTQTVLARDPDAPNASIAPTIPNPSIFNSLEDVINAAAQFIRPLFLITFGAMILFAAATIMTARSDAAKVQSGRQILMAAIIGFALAVFAPAIVNFVTGLLGVNGFNFSTN